MNSDLFSLLPREGRTLFEPQEACLARVQEAFGKDIAPETLLGQLLYGTGGVVLAQGIRLYGSGVLSFLDKNTLFPGKNFYLIGEDIWGGLFGLSKASGEKFYFEPDSLEWLELEGDLEDFFAWLQSPLPEEFYHDLRWEGWATDAAMLAPSQGFLFSPPLWEEDDLPIEERQRTVVAMDELILQEFEAACVAEF